MMHLLLREHCPPVCTAARPSSRRPVLFVCLHAEVEQCFDKYYSATTCVANKENLSNVLFLFKLLSKCEYLQQILFGCACGNVRHFCGSYTSLCLEFVGCKFDCKPFILPAAYYAQLHSALLFVATKKTCVCNECDLLCKIFGLKVNAGGGRLCVKWFFAYLVRICASFCIVVTKQQVLISTEFFFASRRRLCFVCVHQHRAACANKCNAEQHASTATFGDEKTKPSSRYTIVVVVTAATTFQMSFRNNNNQNKFRQNATNNYISGQKQYLKVAYSTRLA